MNCSVVDTASSTSVARYLGWLSINARTFNVGQYRRNNTPTPAASFFDTSNKEGERLRRAAAEAAIADMIKWFQAGDNTVAILDATNSTKDRRRWIQERCASANIETLFVESKCDDEDLVMTNILDVKTTSPDYAGQNPEEAARDFRERIKNYEKVYETIDEDESDLTYVKLINVGSQVIINRIQDYLQSRVVYYLMNLHIKPRSIWISRVCHLPYVSHPLLHAAHLIHSRPWQPASSCHAFKFSSVKVLCFALHLLQNRTTILPSSLIPVPPTPN